MTSITQAMRYRLSLIRVAEKHGVSKAAIIFKTNSQYIYRWKRRFDGTLESLRDRSRRPHHHPNQHTPDEIKLIHDMRMTSITQDMRYRLSLIRFAEKHGVSKAAIKYKTNRQYIYRWKRRYDGPLESLRDRSRRPHHHPNQHTPDEIKLIHDMRRRNPNAGLFVFWVKLMQRGYTRSIPGAIRVPFPVCIVF